MSLINFVADVLGLVTREELDERLADERIATQEMIAMTAAAQYDEVLTRLADRIGMLVAENASIRDAVKQKDEALAAAATALSNVQDQLAAEQASEAAEVQRQVQEALEADAQKDLARVEALLTAAGGELPGDVPDVPVPDPGQPADPPDGSDVTPVDEPPDTPVPSTGDNSDGSGDAGTDQPDDGTGG